MKITHENVVQQLKQNNEAALDFVVDHYGGLIKSIVAHHLQRFRHIHDECIDDIFLGVWNHIDSFNAKTNSLENWIAAISKYKAIDYKRKYIEQAEKKQLAGSDWKEHRQHEMIKMKREVSMEIESLTDHLTAKDQELFSAYYIEKDNAILAVETEMDHSVIHDQLFWGRKKLKKLRRILGWN